MNTPEQSATPAPELTAHDWTKTPRTRAAISIYHHCAAADIKTCCQLETELATAQRLLAEERRHAEDMKAHQAQPRGRTDGERLDWSIDYPDEFASITNAIKWTGDAAKNKSLWRSALDAAMSRTEGRAT